MPPRTIVLVTVLLAFSSVIGLAHSVHALEQSTDQQKCSNALSKDAAKVFAAQATEAGKCQSQFAGEQVASADACIAADLKQKVSTAAQKTTADEAAKCVEAPDFGAGSSGLGAMSMSTAAIEAALSAVVRMFGENIDLGTIPASENKDQAKCQQSGLKAARKCAQVIVKEFNACKKLGLKGNSPPGTIGSGEDLETACFQALAGDSKGKIAKACGATADGAIASAVSKKCQEAGLDQTQLDAAFPCVDPPVAAAELSRLAKCRACLYLNAAEGVSGDCDAFDDGAPNVSCQACTDLPAVMLDLVPSDVCIAQQSQSAVVLCQNPAPLGCTGDGCAADLQVLNVAADPNAGTVNMSGSFDASGADVEVDLGLGLTADCIANPATVNFNIAISSLLESSGCGFAEIDATWSTSVNVTSVNMDLVGGFACESVGSGVIDLIEQMIEATIESQLATAVQPTAILGREVCTP